jgi:hypothetical protein
VQLELATFTELSEAGAQTDKVWACYRNAKAHRRLRHIVNSVLLKPKAVWFVRSIDKVNQVLSLWESSPDSPRYSTIETHDVVCNLSKDEFTLVVSQRAHFRPSRKLGTIPYIKFIRIFIRVSHYV